VVVADKAEIPWRANHSAEVKILPNKSMLVIIIMDEILWGWEYTIPRCRIRQLRWMRSSGSLTYSEILVIGNRKTARLDAAP